MAFPERISQYIRNLVYRKDEIGNSGDDVYVFEDRYVLKVSGDPERMKREKERTDFLTQCGIPGSRSIDLFEENGRWYYLRTCIRGDSLIAERFMQDPELLADVLAGVFDVLKSLDHAGCPFHSLESEGSEFVHGDLCLPNIYVSERNEFAGFIDVENCGLGDRWHDYAWLLWSMQYNFRTDRWNSLILKKLGVAFDEKKYLQYIAEADRQVLRERMKRKPEW